MSDVQSETESKKPTANKKTLKLASLDDALDNTTSENRPGLLSNSFTVQEGNKQYSYPIAPEEIWERLKELTNNAVKRCAASLFIVLKNKDIHLISKAPSLFGQLFHYGLNIRWSDKVKGAITKSEFLDFCLTSADYYDFIMEYPLYPPMENVFYKHMVEPQSTGKLDKLLEFFNPATETDRLLLKAAFVTVFWGKSAGKKPAFVFDGDDGIETKEGKQGIGKTTIIDAMARLIAEDYIDMSYKSDVEDMKKQLLGAQGRIVRFDNVKAGILNSEAIESLITAESISGHRMYVGQTAMPNLFTYCFTFNDATMSKDMSQRSVVIKIKRPTYSPDWVDRLNAFIDENRMELIADIGWILCKAEDLNRPAKTRFSKWERQVLQKVTEQDLGEYLKGCQQSVDDSVNITNDIRELIENKIAEYVDPYDTKTPINPEESVVAIKTTILHGWLKELLGKGYSDRHIKKKLMAYRPDEIEKDLNLIGGIRFYVWSKQGSGVRKSAYKISSEIKVSNLAAAWMREKAPGVRNREDDASVRAPHLSELM